MPSLLVPVALLALLVAACGGTDADVVGFDPVVVCDPSPIEPVAALTCERAINAAIPALGAAPVPIVRITFFYGAWCPPNARCPFAGPDRGEVVFEFADRSWPLAVHVEQRGGEVLAEPPARVPEWWVDSRVDARGMQP